MPKRFDSGFVRKPVATVAQWRVLVRALEQAEKSARELAECTGDDRASIIADSLLDLIVSVKLSFPEQEDE